MSPPGVSGLTEGSGLTGSTGSTGSVGLSGLSSDGQSSPVHLSSSVGSSSFFSSSLTSSFSGTGLITLGTLLVP